MRIEIIIKHIGYVLLFNAAFLFIAYLISAFLGELIRSSIVVQYLYLRNFWFFSNDIC